MLKKIVISCAIILTLHSCKSQEIEAASYFDIVRPEFKGDVAMETTAFVEKYWRIAGNTGFNETVYKIESKLKEAGFVLEENATDQNRLVYRIETRPLKNPTWEPIEASLSIVGQDAPILKYETNRNMIFKNSVSTPKEGVVANVVYIKDAADLKNINVKGKVVFAEMSPRRLYKTAILDGGALGIITYNNPDYLQPAKNMTSIQFRSMPYNKGGKAWGIALSYAAKKKLKAAVLKGETKVNVNIKTKHYKSEELTIIANVIGSELPKESLVFSAHIQEPGANDNATGVGTQLEMAMLTSKLLNEDKINAKRTLTFLWGDEIISTRRYVNEKSKRNASINWGISLDMVGENTTMTGGSFLIEKMPDPSAIWTRGNDKHSEWGGRPLKEKDMTPHYLNDFIIDIFKTQGRYANWEVNTNPFEGGSDHTPFLRADIPGLLLWHFTDQFYHTDNDRIDKVSQETMKNVGIGALVSAYTLINANKETALNLIKTLEITAKKRLNIEFALSKKAISSGGSIKEESKILNSWSNWYINTFGTLSDMEPNKNDELNTAILNAQRNLETITVSLINQL